MLLQMGGMNSQLTAFCMHPVGLVTGNELHVGRWHAAWFFDGRFSSCQDFRIWPKTNNCLTVDDRCGMLMEASLWWTTQLKTSRFFGRHLQHPCPKCINTQMIKTAGQLSSEAFNQFRI